MALELIKACCLKLPEKEKEQEEPAGDGYEELDETEAIKRIADTIHSDYHILRSIVGNLGWDYGRDAQIRHLANHIAESLKGTKVKP